MGDLSAMNGIDRVINAHGEELQREYAEQAPEIIRQVFCMVALENVIYGIDLYWVFQDGSSIPGPTIAIDTLADRFPDCAVGY